MRRKSFSLVLLILIIILVVFLVVLLVSLINKPHKESTNSSQTSQTIENKLDSSFIESLNDIESSGTENTSTSGEETQTQTESNKQATTPEEETQTISLNEHNYKLDKKIKTSIVDSSSGNKELKYEIDDKDFTIQYGSSSEKSFQDLKASEDLTGYIESKFGVSLTSKLKTGKINNLDLIICSVSKDSRQYYLLFTPLTDSEVAYAKLFKKTNKSELLDDLSEALNEISSIIVSKE